MKSFFVMAAVLLLLLSSAAGAKGVQQKSLSLDSVVVVGDASFVSAVVSHDGDSGLSDGRVAVIIPEFGLRAAKRVGVEQGGRRLVVLPLAGGISKKGDYYASFIVGSGGSRRITHRVITIG